MLNSAVVGTFPHRIGNSDPGVVLPMVIPVVLFVSTL